MGSDSIKLPLIDFSKQGMKPGMPKWDEVKDQVRRALEEYGCFEAVFDKVPGKLQQATFDAVEELFDLPLETKLRNTSTKPFHGYDGQYRFVPLYEVMGIGDANIIERVDSVTNVLWPQGNSSFCNTIQSYSEKLSELDQIVRRMILESLGVEKYIDEHLESANYLLRVMKYKGPQTEETELGLPAHTDKGNVTILCENQVNGLEVQTKDGEWIQVKPSPNNFIVLIGDSLYAWANGRLHSPYHRVMMTGNEARYSIGLFSTPKAGYIIKAAEELVDERHPLLFKPFDHDEFIDFYHSDAFRKAVSASEPSFGVSALATYCGV